MKKTEIRTCFILIILSVIIANACNQVESKHFLFETELTTYQRFPIHKALSPDGLHTYKDYLIISQVNNSGSSVDFFFEAYIHSDFTYAGSFGRRGRGPNEWINLDVVGATSNPPYFYFWDVSSRSPTAVIHKMIIDSTIHLMEVDTFHVQKGLCFMNHPVIKNDSLLVFDEYSPEPALRVHHLNHKKPVLTWTWGSLPIAVRAYDENYGRLLANESCIMFVYLYKNMIDFMDWDLKLVKRLNYQNGKPVIVYDSSDNVEYYRNSYLGEHFLYCFFLGMSTNERKATSNLSLALEVYDMNGTPVYRYTFSDPSPHDRFTVDESTFTLYGYRGDYGMEDFIYVYQLPGLKEYLEQK